MTENAESIGKGLLAVREAHRYCVSNPIYPGAHDFDHCPVLFEFRRMIYNSFQSSERPHAIPLTDPPHGD